MVCTIGSRVGRSVVGACGIVGLGVVGLGVVEVVVVADVGGVVTSIVGFTDSSLNVGSGVVIAATVGAGVVGANVVGSAIGLRVGKDAVGISVGDDVDGAKLGNDDEEASLPDSVGANEVLGVGDDEEEDDDELSDGEKLIVGEGEGDDRPPLPGTTVGRELIVGSEEDELPSEDSEVGIDDELGAADGDDIIISSVEFDEA